jgi:hypothetical protein
VALTRIISGGIPQGRRRHVPGRRVESVFDPRGGYWQAGGKFMPSIIAELGYVIEKHLQTIGLLKKQELDEHAQKLIAVKKAEFEEEPGRPMRSPSRIFPKGRSCAPSAAPPPSS